MKNLKLLAEFTAGEIFYKAKDILQNLSNNYNESEWFPNVDSLKAEHEV